MSDLIVYGVLVVALIVVVIALVQPRSDEFDNDNDRGMW